MSKEVKNPAFREPSSKAQLALWRGQSYWIRGDYKKAEECFTNMMADFSDQPAMVGEAYFHRARLRATALKAYNDAEFDIGRIPVPYLKHFVQGELHFSRGEHGAAAAEFEQVIEKLPPRRVSNTEPVLALKRLAKCYTTLGDAVKAADALARLTEYESTNK